MQDDVALTGLDAITTRERECLRLVFAGYRAKEIARTLGVSAATVNNHLASARRKVGASDSRAIARALFAQGRTDDVVKEWLDETTTIVSAAAEELHHAVREEASGASTRTEEQRRFDPALGFDPARTAPVGPGSIDHDRVPHERPGTAGGDAHGSRANPRILDRGDVELEPELSAVSGGASSHELTAFRKALWIMGLTLGIAFVAGAALPGMLLLIHSLQSLTAGKPLLVR